MRIEGHHFIVSLAAAALVNVLVVFVLMPWTEGVNSKAIGPQIDFDVTAGGLLGAAVAPTEAAEDSTTEDPLPEDKTAEDIPEEQQIEDIAKSETTDTKLARVEDTADPVVEAEVIEIEEPVSEDADATEPTTAEPEPEIQPVPQQEPVRQIKKKVNKKTKAKKPAKKKAKPTKSKNKKKKTTKKSGKSRKRAKSGSRSRGAGGHGKGGGGKARASRGAISSYKSRVQARMASCVRRRVSGRGAGRVTIRFGISSGGGIRGVSVSGSGSLRGAASAAARGCSMPAPPRGAGRLRFAFPVRVR